MLHYKTKIHKAAFAIHIRSRFLKKFMSLGWTSEQDREQTFLNVFLHEKLSQEINVRKKVDK